METKEMFILKFTDGRFVAKDLNNGGKAYGVDDFRSAHIWFDINEVKKYLSFYPDFYVHRLKIEEENVII